MSRLTKCAASSDCGAVQSQDQQLLQVDEQLWKLDVEFKQAEQLQEGNLFC